VAVHELDNLDLFGEVADALIALSNLELGDYSSRLEIPKSKALEGLFAGINTLIAAMGKEEQRIATYRRQLEEKLETIEQQRVAIRDLSTPILEVWDGVICLPVVGVVDTVRSAEMTSELLDVISRRRTRWAIIDVTGIDVMDTSTAEHFIRMAKSASLLGSKCVLTGINPNIAQTVVHMGVDLRGLRTQRTLRDALQKIVSEEMRASRTRPVGRAQLNGAAEL
jgi:rsbT co-antagonist protein RsbR